MVEEDNLRIRIRKAQEKDEQVVKAVEELKKLGINVRVTRHTNRNSRNILRLLQLLYKL